MKYEATAGSDTFGIEINDDGSLFVDGEPARCDFQKSPDPHLYSLLLDNRSYDLRVTREEEAYRVLIEGENLQVVVTDERSRRLASASPTRLGVEGEIIVKAPMPGLIIDVPVTVGEEVDLGRTLVILESMKMHNEFKPPRRAVVKEVRARKGDKVQRNQTLVILS